MKLRFYTPLLLALIGTGFAGCSLDMFSKERHDPAVQGRENYRRVHPECSGLKIEKSELDSAVLRSLVRCFNANGSIPEIAALVNDASEKTLSQAVGLLNTTFLSEPKVLAESRGIIRKLDAEKKWEPLVAGFQSALQDPTRLQALVRLLSVGSAASGTGAPFPNLVPETIARFSPLETMAGFELLGRLVHSKAFRDLQRKMSESPLSAAERSRLIAILTDFFKCDTPYRSAALLVDDMASGKSSTLWEYAFGSDSADLGRLLDQSSRFYTLLREFAAERGESLRKLSLFHQGFHHPVSCWGGGKRFAEPWKNLNEEIIRHSSEDRLLPFFTRFATLTAMGIGDLCEVPSQFFDHYPAVMKLTAGRTGGEYLGVLSRVFSADMGRSAGYFVGEWGESLAEVLSIISDRPWFSDLLLLLAELDSEDRSRIGAWIEALLRDRNSWAAKSANWSAGDVGKFFSDFSLVFSADPDQISTWIDSVQSLFESSRSHPWFQGWKKIAAGSDEMGVSALASLPSFPAAAQTLAVMAGDGRLATLLEDILDLLGGGSAVSLEGDISIREVSVHRLLRHGFSGADLHEVDTPAILDESLIACTSLDLRKLPSEQWEVYLKCLSGGGVETAAYAGLWKAQAAPFPEEPSVSFPTSIIRSFVTLPLTTLEKREVIAMISGKRDGLVGLTADSLASLARIARDLFSPLIRVAGRLQASVEMNLDAWNTFFKKMETALLNPKFSPGVRALQGLEKPGNPYDREVIGPAAEPGPELLSQAVKGVECLSSQTSVSARAEEVALEYREGVLGWERPEGSLPLFWRPEILAPRLRALSDSLESDSLRNNLYRWIAGLNPKASANWFFQRAQDPRLVAIMDPESRTPRVRWMTSLDRLESILVNSNFNYLLPGNHGVTFIKKFAESWGDEPRARWPREIQERYSGKNRPPTLRETYEHVLEFLEWFERGGGMPAIPPCVQSGLVSKPWASAPDFIVDFSVKTKAYNLKQTISVIEENLPGSGGPNAGGMKLLRDLFWAVSSARPESNPVQFLQRFGDLGGLRLLSRGLQTIRTRGELAAVEDVFGGLAGLVSEPAFNRILTRAILSPTSFETWVSAAFKPATYERNGASFSFSKFMADLLGAVAVDRTLQIGPSLLRTIDQFLSPGKLPEALVGDLIRLSSVTSSKVALSTLRAKDEAAERQLHLFSRFFQTQGTDLIRALPIAKLLRDLDRDPLLRKEVFSELLRLRTIRQVNDEIDLLADGSEPVWKPYFDLFLSEKNPELRHMFALWCGKSAGRYAFEISSHPDESFLIIDGLLRSVDSPGFKDFLEALLRQLPD